MIKFINYHNNIFISLCFSIILFIIIDKMIFYFGSKLFNEKYSIINQIIKNDPKMIVLGSSTSKYSINPDFFDIKTFNSSSNGNGIIYSNLLLSNIPLNSIDYIFLGIDPANFAIKANYENYGEMLLFSKHPDYFEDLLRETGVVNNITENLQSYKVRSLPKVIKNYYLDSSHNGYSPLYGNLISSKSNKKNKNDIECHDYPLNDYSVAALVNIADIAKSKDIKIISTIIPIYAGIENSPGGMRNQNPCFFSIMKFINSISEKYQFCNLTQKYPKEVYNIANNRSYFYDSSHLNHIGAGMYSKILNNWINDTCL